MNKFMTVVTNKWFRMAVSLLGIAYSIVLACFDYNVFFYDIEYVSRKEFAIIGSVFSGHMPAVHVHKKIGVHLYFRNGEYAAVLPAAIA